MRRREDPLAPVEEGHRESLEPTRERLAGFARKEPSDDTDAADDRLATAARTLLSRHDEGNRLEARLFDVVHALERSGQLDDGMIRSALDAGEISMLAEALGRRAGIEFDTAWESVLGGSSSLALLLRMSGASRMLAGEIVAGTSDVLPGDPESAMAAFDRLGDEEVEAARKWLRLDPAFRSAICALDSDDGHPSV